MVEPIMIKTKDGKEVKVGTKYQGIFWLNIVADPVKSWRDYKSFPYQDGDVFLCTFPKTGTNWVMDILHMLRNGTTDMLPIVTRPLEVTLPEVPDQPCPRIMATHLTYQNLPDQHIKEGGKIIVVCRNPKDTAVAFYHFVMSTRLMSLDVKFEEFLQLFKSGILSDYVEFYSQWDKAIKVYPEMPVHILRYEDLKQNGLTELRKVCRFLNFDRSDDFLKEVLDQTEIQKVKAAKGNSSMIQHMREFFNPIGGDPLLMYRKG